MTALLSFLLAAQLTPARAMTEIEAVQSPNREGHDPFTLGDILDKPIPR